MRGEGVEKGGRIEFIGVGIGDEDFGDDLAGGRCRGFEEGIGTGGVENWGLDVSMWQLNSRILIGLQM